MIRGTLVGLILLAGCCNTPDKFTLIGDPERKWTTLHSEVYDGRRFWVLKQEGEQPMLLYTPDEYNEKVAELSKRQGN